MTLLLNVAIELMIPILFSPQTVKFYFILQSLPVVSSQGIPGAWLNNPIQFGRLISSRQGLELGACPHQWLRKTEKLYSLRMLESLCAQVSLL